MRTEAEAQLLRILVGETDRWEGRPLYEAIVRAARDHGLSGATALRGIEGFGSDGRIHTVKVLRLSEDLPIVIEIVDRPDRIAAFLPVLDTMVGNGLVTLEKVHAIRFEPDAQAATPESDELQLEDFDYVPVEPISAPSVQKDPAQQLLEAAQQSAAESRRRFPDSADVLLVMLCHTDGVPRSAITSAGLDCAALERAVHDTVSRDEPSAEFLTDLEQRAQAEARWLGAREVGPEHLLLALCELRPSVATDTLMLLGVQPRDICKEVLTLLGHEDDWQRWLSDHPDM